MFIRNHKTQSAPLPMNINENTANKNPRHCEAFILGEKNKQLPKTINEFG